MEALASTPQTLGLGSIGMDLIKSKAQPSWPDRPIIFTTQAQISTVGLILYSFIVDL
jgi:hypothetical protein